MKTLLLLSIILWSCAAFPQPILRGGDRIKTEVEYTSDTMLYDVSEYTYDSAGRLTATLFYGYYKDTNGVFSKDDDTTYYLTYSHDSVLRGRVAPFVLQYRLDTHGRVVINEDGTTYSYDQSGHVLLHYTDGGTGIDSMHDGDLIRTSWHSLDSTEYATYTYTYYPELDPRHCGEVSPYVPHRHLIRTWSIHQFNDHDHTDYYTYEYDAQHRVAKEICKGPGRSTIRKYTYY